MRKREEKKSYQRHTIPTNTFDYGRIDCCKRCIADLGNRAHPQDNSVKEGREFDKFKILKNLFWFFWNFANILYEIHQKHLDLEKFKLFLPLNSYFT